MFGDPNKPKPDYFVFIDEAGDPGLRAVRPLDARGATEWFVLGAVVVSAQREPDVVAWVREIKHEVRQTQRTDLHYKNLVHSRRVRACQMLAGKEVRLFATASHKVNMSGYRNDRAEKLGAHEYFYNWNVRILLERVTAWIHRDAMRRFKEPRLAQLVFSHRGGMRYSQLVAYHEYMRRQSAGGGLYLNRNDLKWDVLHPDYYQSIAHRQSAGAQLADLVASAIYQAADARAPTWSCQPARALGPRLGRKGRLIANSGLTLLPLPPKRPELTADQAEIFRYFGYDLDR